MKLISFLIVCGFASQFYCIGAFGPIFFFLHYVQSPLADYTALDWRLVNVTAVRTALIAIALGLIFPTSAMYSLPDLHMRPSVSGEVDEGEHMVKH
jgi:hypothetical protein